MVTYHLSPHHTQGKDWGLGSANRYTKALTFILTLNGHKLKESFQPLN